MPLGNKYDDYGTTAEGEATCTKCGDDCFAIIISQNWHPQAVSDCHYAPAKWEWNGRVIETDELWMHPF